MKDEILIQRIEEVTGQHYDSPKDFNQLSELIFSKTEEMVSPTTLKRIWGYLDSASSPRSYTLDVLARFLGYRDYEAFKTENQHPDVQSDITLCDKVSCEDLAIGDLLELSWLPNRVCRVEHLGGGNFRIVEAQNTKLSVGDTFSLLNAFQDRDYTNYWFSSGTPTYLIEMLRKFHVVPSDLSKIQVLASDFDAPTENMRNITPLLYQSGYVTIKDFNRTTRLYTLDIPNNEIRVGLMDSLLPNYVEMRKEAGNTTIARMYLALLNEDLDEMFRLLQAYLLTVPYCDNANSEGHYQQMLYIIFSLFGRYVEVEVHTPTGRVDIVMKTDKALNESAIQGKVDFLEGLKENVICGHLLPAGTGTRGLGDDIVGNKEDLQLLEAKEA